MIILLCPGLIPTIALCPGHTPIIMLSPGLIPTIALCPGLIPMTLLCPGLIPRLLCVGLGMRLGSIFLRCNDHSTPYNSVCLLLFLFLTLSLLVTVDLLCLKWYVTELPLRARLICGMSQLSHETRNFNSDLMVSRWRPHFSQSTVREHDRLT